MDPTGGYDEYSFVSEFYDYVDPYKERPDVAFYIDEARRSGGPVLEIGCGTGRVLIPTARAGVEIVGLDLAEAMLATCQETLAKEPEDVIQRTKLINADMCDFELGRKFSLATIPFRPFQHLLTTDAQLACLQSIHRHLEDGGRLIVDLFNPNLSILIEKEFEAEWGDEPEIQMPDGRRVVRRMRRTAHDPFHQVNHVEIIYYVTHPDGREERLVHAFKMRYLFRYEAEHLLHRTGFEVENLYADYERKPYGSIYPGELIFVAVKR
ncbi:MAG: class I SAM-dependent methyltransferase [Candidatus Eisenbacteria bacterium]|uniref:Class I SAM-dependent methyltransferase n=1 Tax=Eiseniibacteriota bacterium TaxID=2212470 RepID=A0A948RX49_UNCEI|nr:class I SAM-dependent methyltransferase [Candidatus Eisenbacteria bacterium]MBU2692658.1 class I SAM-dependent methyltransferase [Candidatus Eisenbacteria bacterium]